MITRPYTAVLIVPTGFGAAIGGYAGDALPVAPRQYFLCRRVRFRSLCPRKMGT